MKNSNFKGGTPPSDRPTYYSSEEDPHQTAVNDRIVQKARYGRGADGRATSHAFKEAARRMVGQGNLQSIMDALELGIPDLADLTGLSRKVLAAIISGKGHVDDEMEDVVSQLETCIRGTSYWFWTDPHKVTPEDIQRFNVKYRPELALPQSTETSSRTQSQQTSVQPETGTAVLAGQSKSEVGAQYEEPQASAPPQESLFEEGPPVEHAASVNVSEASLGQKSWQSTPSKSAAAPFFSGGAGAQVIRRKRRSSKEGVIAAENLRKLLAALQIDAGWLADRIGASGKALKLILTGKGAGDEEAMRSVQYLEYPLRGKRGWFWTELYTPTSEDIDRFNSRYSAHLFQEVPGSPVRRNAADLTYSFEPTRSTDTTQPQVSETPETQNEAHEKVTSDEQVPAMSVKQEEPTTALESAGQVNVTSGPEQQNEGSPEAAAAEDIPEEVAEPVTNPEVEKRGPVAAPELEETATSALRQPAATTPLNIFVVGADDGAAKAKRTGTKAGKIERREQPVSSAPREATTASKGLTEPLPTAEQSRIQTVLGNLSRLSAVLDLGLDEFQQTVGISGSMMAQMREGQYSPEAHQAIRRLEAGLFLMARELEETHFDPSGFLLSGFRGRMAELLTEAGPALVQPAIKAAEFPAPVVRAPAPTPAPVPKRAAAPAPAPAPAPVVKPATKAASKPKQQPAAAEPKRRGRPPKQQEDTGRQDLVAKNLVSLCGGGTKRFSVRAVTGIPAQRMDALLNESSPVFMTRDEEHLIEEALFLGQGWFAATKHKAMPKAEFQARVDARIKGRAYP